MTLVDLVDAIQANNDSAGGSVLRRGSMDLVIRSAGHLENAQEIADIFVKSVEGTPVYIRDVATVKIDTAIPWSVFSKNRTDGTVQGMVLLRRGENPSFVFEKLKEAVEELNASVQMEGESKSFPITADNFWSITLTILYVLFGGLVFAMFVVTVLSTFFFRRGYTEWENPLLQLMMPVYTPLFWGLLHIRVIVVTFTVFALILVLYHLMPRLGVEFLPYLDEGTIWVKANFPDGTSLEQTAAFGKEIREIVLEYPDIEFIAVQVGRADAWSEPFPASRIEIMIGPKPQSQWTQFKTKREIVAAIGERLRAEFPTTRFSFTQPIIDMVTQDTNGTSAQLALEISGDDFARFRHCRRWKEMTKADSYQGDKQVVRLRRRNSPAFACLPLFCQGSNLEYCKKGDVSANLKNRQFSY